MDIKPISESTATGSDEGLDRCGGVQKLSLPAGQVLIYRGNKAPGVFMFLSGCVRSGARVWRSDDTHQPFLIPDVSSLDSPFPENVTIEDDAAALFVPRSVVLRERSVQQLLEFIPLKLLSAHAYTPSQGAVAYMIRHLGEQKMRPVQELWPGPVCTQPECALKQHGLNQDGLAKLIVEALSQDRPIAQDHSNRRIKPRDVCKDCALRVLRGEGAFLTASEKERLIEAGRWSTRRRRRRNR